VVLAFVPHKTVWIIHPIFYRSEVNAGAILLVQFHALILG